MFFGLVPVAAGAGFFFESVEVISCPPAAVLATHQCLIAANAAMTQFLLLAAKAHQEIVSGKSSWSINLFAPLTPKRSGASLCCLILYSQQVLSLQVV